MLRALFTLATAAITFPAIGGTVGQHKPFTIYVPVSTVEFSVPEFKQWEYFRGELSNTAYRILMSWPDEIDFETHPEIAIKWIPSDASKWQSALKSNTFAPYQCVEQVKTKNMGTSMLCWNPEFYTKGYKPKKKFWNFILTWVEEKKSVLSVQLGSRSEEHGWSDKKFLKGFVDSIRLDESGFRQEALKKKLKPWVDSRGNGSEYELAAHEYIRNQGHSPGDYFAREPKVSNLDVTFDLWHRERLLPKYASWKGDPTGKCMTLKVEKKDEGKFEFKSHRWR